MTTMRWIMVLHKIEDEVPKVDKPTLFLVLSKGDSWSVARFYPERNTWNRAARSNEGYSLSIPVVYWAELPSPPKK